VVVLELRFDIGFERCGALSVLLLGLIQGRLCLADGELPAFALLPSDRLLLRLLPLALFRSRS
jgi:hypothetical protein